MPARRSSDHSDSGQAQYLDYASSLTTDPLAMRTYNGHEFSKRNRQAPQSDVDLYPYLIRRFTNMSVTDVQIHNGLRWGVASGRRVPYYGTGWLNVIQPIIPGQTRDNVAGWHRKGPSPYRWSNNWQDGPGSQPANPGGPGKIAAPMFVNPMTG